MKYIILFMLFLSTSLYSQTAKVIQLSPEDANSAKSLYEQKTQIEVEIWHLQDRIKKEYINDPYRWGSTDFEFSDDFKFIVPMIYNFPQYNLGEHENYIIPYSGTIYGTTAPCGTTCLNWVNPVGTTTSFMYSGPIDLTTQGIR